MMREEPFFALALEAEAAGCKVDFLPHFQEHPTYGFWKNALVVNDSVWALQELHNAQSRLNRKQVHAYTCIYLPTIKKFAGTIFGVNAPGYESMTLVVPHADLYRAFFADRIGVDRVSVYIPLVYRPDNPIFDFWAYRDAWHHTFQTAIVEAA